MPGFSRTILIACWAIAMSAAIAHGEVDRPALSDAVPGAEGVTYADLVRLIVPDIAAADGTHVGSRVIQVRHIADRYDGVEAEPPERIALDRVDALPLFSDGRDRLALLVNLGVAKDSAEGFAVLALYDVTGKPVLLDAANVAFDRFISLFDPARLALGDAQDLLMARSTHFNSHQAYATTVLVLPRGDSLELVDAISTFDDNACAFDRVQRLEVTVGDGASPAPILATVREETSATGNECGDATVPGPPSREIGVTYRWDAGLSRYVPDSDAFEVLGRENAERF